MKKSRRTNSRKSEFDLSIDHAISLGYSNKPLSTIIQDLNTIKVLNRNEALTVKDLKNINIIGLDYISISVITKSLNNLIENQNYYALQETLIHAVQKGYGEIKFEAIIEDKTTLKELTSLKKVEINQLRLEAGEVDISERSLYILIETIDYLLSINYPFLTIDQIINSLSLPLKKIIEDRFGMLMEKRTLKEIGVKLNITRERVRQIEKNAINGLRRYESLLDPKIVKKIRKYAELGTPVNQVSGLSELYKDSATLILVSEAFKSLNTFIFNDLRLKSPVVLKKEEISLINSKIVIMFDYLLNHDGAIFMNELEAQTGVPLNTIKNLKNVDYSDDILLHRHNKYLATLEGKIIATLKELNRPLKIDEIVKYSGLNFDQVRGRLGRNHRNGRLVNIGPSTYALKEWGYEHGFSADIAYYYLKESGVPRKSSDVTAYVLKQRNVKKGSVLAAIAIDSRFYHPELGYLALSEWIK